jgi:hypothetical protein
MTAIDVPNTHDEAGLRRVTGRGAEDIRAEGGVVSGEKDRDIALL